MNILALVVNVVWVVVFCAFFFKEDAKQSSDYLYLAVLIPAVLSIAALARARDSYNWLALYLKRKAVEERLRIRTLEERE